MKTPFFINLNLLLKLIKAHRLSKHLWLIKYCFFLRLFNNQREEATDWNTYVEDFKTSNIQYTNEMLSLLLGIQSLVTLLDEPFEEPVEHGLRHGTNGILDLADITALCDEFVTYFNSWFQKSQVQSGCVDAQELSNAFTFLKPNHVHFCDDSFQSQTSVPSASACSSRPLCLNFIPPMCMTDAVIL